MIVIDVLHPKTFSVYLNSTSHRPSFLISYVTTVCCYFCTEALLDCRIEELLWILEKMYAITGLYDFFQSGTYSFPAQPLFWRFIRGLLRSLTYPAFSGVLSVLLRCSRYTRHNFEALKATIFFEAVLISKPCFFPTNVDDFQSSFKINISIDRHANFRNRYRGAVRIIATAEKNVIAIVL